MPQNSGGGGGGGGGGKAEPPVEVLSLWANSLCARGSAAGAVRMRWRGAARCERPADRSLRVSKSVVR
jgi:hypothetical protein